MIIILPKLTTLKQFYRKTKIGCLNPWTPCIRTEGQSAFKERELHNSVIDKGLLNMFRVRHGFIDKAMLNMFRVRHGFYLFITIIRTLRSVK